MDIQHLLQRVKGILLSPDTEWHYIKNEQRSNKELILFYVLPLAAIAALISFVVILSNTYLGFGLALRFAVLKLVMPVVAVIAVAFGINELASTFNSVKDLNSAFKLAAYSYTPALLAGIVASISWTLSWVSLFGLYGIYLVWAGLPVLMNTPRRKQVVYILAIVVIVLVVNMIVGALFGIERLAYY